MKKLLVVFLCLLVIGGAYTVAKESDGPYVNASSTVTKELSPNFAEISVSVETKAKVAEDASKENAEISSAVVKNLKAILDSRRGDQIETVNYSVNPQYNYKDGKSNITGYAVSNTVKIKTRDVKSVSAIIDEAMKSGANRVSGLHFGFDDEGLVCNELYAKATKNAYSQAQAVAKAIGSEVTGARTINTSCSIEGQSNYSYRMYKSANGLAADMEKSSTPIEAKSLKVRATIDGTFNIK